ncbi:MULTISPECIES: type II toxin-antitoxin system HipA family toxin [unclassified Rhodanobacter]|uniref:type II toxin-antitoxin system HipA family toxin n=1 Tax=unclassified Rhodanobacter TaxID=2621553 RepID=UPI001BDE8E23|nr:MULTISPECIES: type II toxin-antitoxin system HipA family toxin [unclassified Rhodanobacter]MBT2143736.1 type II toxin-antitoxin system HipA family toxin [Rhodanobacter sp. LX-99]MBT2147190.1 type II toxin-antitoxin system HipA family toxin [Rhodanobacter sp. LX-100]
MTTHPLIAVMNGAVIGTITRERTGRLRFDYADDWRQRPDAIPLSLSMPLVRAGHPHAVVDAFLWGLLPDNEQTLARWASRLRVSARNAYGLLAHIGEDCAGAVQFVPADRLGALQNPVVDDIGWLDEAEIGERLRALRQDPSATRRATDHGQFSLAGAQPKTALLLRDGRWGVPAGRTPTTHILKPPTGAFDGHAENEHFCLALARRLGLPVAHSEVRQFDGEPAIVVARFDRIEQQGQLLRVHQEDLCQALAVPPTRKYQSDGGPGPVAIAEVLRTHSSAPSRDVDTFIDALAFNWLIAGTNAHAKNYALLFGSGGRIRLAPLYDLGSALPYPALRQDKLAMAMKIGNTYRLRDIRRHHWETLLRDLRVNADAALARIAGMAAALPDHADELARSMQREGLTHPILDQLPSLLADSAREKLSRLVQPPANP